MNEVIKSCFIAYANTVAETVQYENWSDKFCRDELKRTNDEVMKAIKDEINWDHLTKDEAINLGFMYWDKEFDLFLIPLWLLPILPIGTKLVCINGKELTYDGHNIDTDIRCGCLAYGIIIKED